MPGSTEKAGPLADAQAPLMTSVSDHFSRTAALFPERTALSCSGVTVSYAALEMQAVRIAQNLLKRGVQPGHRVALYMARSPETIAAILGVLKAGATYVPFDPSYPPALLQFIAEDSAPSLIIAQRALLDSKGGLPFTGTTTLDIASDFPAVQEPLAALPAVGPDDCAYIMYTSGSTGRPKGVRVPHRAILRLVIDNDFARFAADETFLQLAPLAFDASTFEIWGALLHGARLAILPSPHPSLKEISATIAAEQVTTAWLTAGLFHLMVDHELEGLKPLRQLLAGGDVLSVAHVAKALAGLPDCRLINGYGPTENTTFSCCHTIPRPLPPGPIPIGRTIRHSESWVLDVDGKPVADGEDGELFVGGPGLALGYLNRPELTTERFVPHPFDTIPGARLYRTGDRVRRSLDGTLEFLGRVDRQVKINGKRVELDEVEAVLRRSGMVGDAAVTAYESGGERRMAAYVTAAARQTVELPPLQAFLRRELPDYMQPASLNVLDALPLSPTGKVDRARLPAPVATASASMPAAPKTELEARLLGIWQEVLGNRHIGIDDNFFDLGGTSLQMLKVHAALSAESGLKLTIIDLFTYPRIRLLAAWLAQPPPPRAEGGTNNSDAQERARRQAAALARARPPQRPVS